MTDTKTPTTKPRKPSFDLNDPTLKEIMAQAVAAALAAQRAELLQAMADQQQAKPANGKSDVSAKNDLAVLRVFKKAGYQDVKPRQNVLTFNRWLELGRRPSEGSKSLKINGLRLFHLSQTRPLTKEEIAGAKAKSAEAVAASKRKIVSITEGASHPQ